MRVVFTQSRWSKPAPKTAPSGATAPHVPRGGADAAPSVSLRLAGTFLTPRERVIRDELEEFAKAALETSYVRPISSKPPHDEAITIGRIPWKDAGDAVRFHCVWGNITFEALCIPTPSAPTWFITV